MRSSDIAEIRIHPALGIARLGNSPDDFYVGPEAPNQVPNEGRPYKDAMGRVKRQAARFRLYAYNREGRVLREVTSATGRITWTVHLANKKGSWYRFRSRFDDVAQRALRNQWTQNSDIYASDPDLRTDLIIDPGPRSVVADTPGVVPLTGGRFAGVDVDLGELRVEASGRLLILGGRGRSDTAVTEKLITDYANNDYWFDDTSDGSVSAEVVLSDGTVVHAMSAHVIVAPPKFTPGHQNLVTLYDIAAVASGVTPARLPDDAEVQFHRDVAPILRRVGEYAWVSGRAVVGHAPGMRADLGDPELLEALGNPDGDPTMRRRIFARIRVPHVVDPTANRQQARLHYMPPLSGDGGDAIDLESPNPEGPPERTWMTVTPYQYDLLQRWSDGKFVTGIPVGYQPIDTYDLADQPAALDRAALQACVGAPFYPGIEMTYIAEDPESWRGPLRLSPSFKAGDVTRWMALPWQADFYECSLHWWPAARPDDVLPAAVAQDFIDGPADGGNRAVATLAERAVWTRGLPDTTPDGDNAMVQYWAELGFVIPRKTVSGERYFVEEERAAFVGINDRDLFFQLMNVEDFPSVLPKARALADRCLARAEAISNDPATARADQFFRYTPDAFQNRLDEIYRELVRSAAASDPRKDPVFKTREHLVERIRQLAPFNLIDGAWLRNIGKTGPMDDVRALLFSIMMDEMGDGEVSQNHCNIYQDLCHSVGLYLPSVRSLEFAYDRSFLDSAFTLPAFELSISQFSDEYFPEILGMTLYLEWSVIDSTSTRDLFEYFGVNAHFYIMHLGIDNAVNGHGQRAAEAIRLHLEHVHSAGGDVAVQQVWRRVWNGYVAFSYTGGVGADLAKLIQTPPSLREQMIALIARKAVYGQYNHGIHMVGANRINAWFQDPPGFLDALVTNGYLTPGDWNGSRLHRLLDFETGPMYRVFTPEEIELWAAYTRSLKDTPAPHPAPAPPVNPAEAMAAVVEQLRPQQNGAPGHGYYSLKDGQGTAHSIAWWFDQPTAALMLALADPANGMIAPGDPVGSPLVTSWLASGGPMGRVFDQPAKVGGGTCRDAVVAWIEAGCPSPARPASFLAARLNTLGQLGLGSTPEVIRGMGTVH